MPNTTVGKIVATGGGVGAGIAAGANSSDTALHVRDRGANSLFRVRGDGARIHKTFTVATLPTCNTAGMTAIVTDATSGTFNSVVAGGGGQVYSALCDGSNWTVH